MTGKRKFLLAVLAVLLAMAVGTGIYLSNFYPAEPAAVTAAQSGEYRGDWLVFAPENPKAGFIFYPGGKVQAEAYAQLLSQLSEEGGLLCVLTPMPGNLAVLAPNRAEDVASAFPEVEHWYIGGHSLGGAMAASYAGKHASELEGLVLLAAYSTADLRDSGLRVLSVRGSEDGVLNFGAYEKDAANLPDSAREVVISGGCHAWFGNYGPQKGDGTPSISPEEQQEQTVGAILELLFGN